MLYKVSTGLHKVGIGDDILYESCKHNILQKGQNFLSRVQILLQSLNLHQQGWFDLLQRLFYQNSEWNGREQGVSLTLNYYHVCQ